MALEKGMRVMNQVRKIIAWCLNSPAKHLATLLGINSELVDTKYLHLSNKIFEKEYTLTPPKDRMLLLPLCMRKNDCPAPQDDEGYHCKKCGKCKLCDITSLAEELGYQNFIVPGGSMIPRLIKKYQPKATLGVACPPELVMFVNMMKKSEIPVQTVTLSKAGCENTDVNLERVENSLIKGIKD